MTSTRLIALPPTGERLDATTLLFSLAVIATVFAGRRLLVDVSGVNR